MNRVSDNYADGLEIRIKELIAERDALAAKLAGIEAQLTQAFVHTAKLALQSPAGHFMPTETNLLGTVTKWVQMHSPHGTPLYLAPGANPDAKDAKRYRHLFNDASLKAIHDACEAGMPMPEHNSNLIEQIIGFYNSKAQADALIDAAIEGAK